MSTENQGAEGRVSQIRLLPVCITLMLFITAVLGLNFSGENLESRPLFQTSSSTETIPLTQSDQEDVPVVGAGSEATTAPFQGVGFRPNYSAELIEDQYDLDYVRCEKCPYGHLGSSKEIGPKSPTYIGYHQGTEIRVRATFDDEFDSIKELVVVPPSNGISPADLALPDEED